jgi:hypothetical protein
MSILAVWSQQHARFRCPGKGNSQDPIIILPLHPLAKVYRAAVPIFDLHETGWFRFRRPVENDIHEVRLHCFIFQHLSLQNGVMPDLAEELHRIYDSEINVRN